MWCACWREEVWMAGIGMLWLLCEPGNSSGLWALLPLVLHNITLRGWGILSLSLSLFLSICLSFSLSLSVTHTHTHTHTHKHTHTHTHTHTHSHKHTHLVLFYITH